MINMYIPFLDILMNDMKSRPTEGTLGIFVLKILISKIQENSTVTRGNDFVEEILEKNNDIPDTDL
ncbi:Uncharacterized protein FWK35_00018367 [Aphis craccivora]|uniref:Uncharacterized protein n=1 Tax=Aphis craccivora TaxID=307492 RepID=A0A6G0YEN5_APHCR|nr:Uncharacterized protein FWK35_00018367 [Aphis craccivora]